MCSVLTVNNISVSFIKLRHICKIEGFQVAAEAKKFNQPLDYFQKHKLDYVFLDRNPHSIDSNDCLKRLLALNKHSTFILVAPSNRESKMSLKHQIQVILIEFYKSNKFLSLHHD